MKIMRVGVDLAKNVFHVHGVDLAEKPVWQRKLSRDKWLGAVLEKLEPGCEVGMEACAGVAVTRIPGEADGATVCKALCKEQ